MATAVLKTVPVNKVVKPKASVQLISTFTAEMPQFLPQMIVCDPPQPIDARGSLSNDELREIAQKNVPPQTWFDGDEEQVF